MAERKRKCFFSSAIGGQQSIKVTFFSSQSRFERPVRDVYWQSCSTYWHVQVVDSVEVRLQPHAFLYGARTREQSKSSILHNSLPFGEVLGCDLRHNLTLFCSLFW